MHGVATGEDRTWEDAYRNRWAHDKVVRSTHGVNCTGSCSWKIYVKGGVVTWEPQQTDYPRTRPDMPNHEPRGCARGASYSWYMYSANRLKYPMVRSSLLQMWRELRKSMDPVAAWETIMRSEGARRRAAIFAKTRQGPQSHARSCSPAMRSTASHASQRSSAVAVSPQWTHAASSVDGVRGPKASKRLTRPPRPR